MKIEIIVVNVKRYLKGHEYNFVPSITGIHLAAITPSEYQVKVTYEQVEKINFNSDADIIALSFFSGFASHAYDLAKKFKLKGKVVIGGGPHVTYNVEEALTHLDAIITGEGESVWERMLDDFSNGQLKRVYEGKPPSLDNNPVPRYDLVPDSFFIKKVVQATRGCPYSCSFCSVPSLNPTFRKRPIRQVLRDINFNGFKHWWQNKIVWFWDDNLTIDRNYIKELLREMIPLKKWWLTQASIDIVNDDELLDLMRKSGCIGIFLGIETFQEDSIKDANKKQNQIEDYKRAVQILHKHKICVMAGLIVGFDSDTQDSIISMSENLKSIHIDVPFLSVLTPFKGTPLYESLESEDRLIKERGWEFYNGYNVAFYPMKLTPQQLLLSHRQLWNSVFSPSYSFKRILRGLFTLRLGAFLMSVFMNVFYSLKQIRGNIPIDMSENNNSEEIL